MDQMILITLSGPELMAEYRKLKADIDDTEIDIDENKDSTDDKVITQVTKWRKALTRLNDSISELETELERRKTASSSQSVQPVQSGRTPPNYKINNMANYINTRVGIFDPGEKSVSIFLSELKTAHDLYVTGDKEWGTVLEGDFLLAAKSRLTQTTLENLSAQEISDFKNFEDFKSKLTKQYAHLSTGFQMLSDVWSMDMKDGEDYTVIGTRLNCQMQSAGQAIEAKFSAEKQKVMTVQDAFSMLAGLRLLEFVRHKDPEVYRQMAGSTLDKVFTVTEVAKEAHRFVSLYRGCDSSHTLYQKPGGSAQQRDGTEKTKRNGKRYKPKCPKGTECKDKKCLEKHFHYWSWPLHPNHQKWLEQQKKRSPGKTFTGAAQDNQQYGGSFVPHEKVIQPMTSAVQSSSDF